MKVGDIEHRKDGDYKLMEYEECSWNKKGEPVTILTRWDKIVPNKE